VIELNLLSVLPLPNPLFFPLDCRIPTTSITSSPPILSPCFVPEPFNACENRERDFSFSVLDGAGTITVVERCTVRRPGVGVVGREAGGVGDVLGRD
jgi:hypothetical protein